MMGALSRDLPLWMTGAHSSHSYHCHCPWGPLGGGAEPASELAQLRGEEAGTAMDTSSPVTGGGIHPTPAAHRATRILHQEPRCTEEPEGGGA